MKEIHAGKYILPIGERTIVMGIVNVTSDSFFDGGKYNTVDLALKRVIQLVEDGADIIDIGGESTRPGSTAVCKEEELERVIPIIEKVSKEVDVPISIDTYKADVAIEAVRAGAHMINDVWGAKRDSKMGKTVAECNVPIILMHNRNDRNYTSFLDNVVHDLFESIILVQKAGVEKDQIILDPGIGFAKNVKENLLILKHIDRLVDLGFPVLLGTSRKSFIGNILDLEVELRLEGTLATVAYGIEKGCQIVRVHDVKETVRLSRMIDAILHA